MAKGKGSGVTPQKVKDLLTETVARESQYAVAKKTGLALSLIQGLLKGDREPTTGTLQTLATYLGVSVPELRGEAVIVGGEEFDGLSKKKKDLILRIARSLNDSEKGQEYYRIYKTIFDRAE